MKQLATMILNGRYKIIYDDKAKYNPYRVYKLSGNSRKMVAKYEDYASALYTLYEIAKAEVLN